jgi:hypothetical protein
LCPGRHFAKNEIAQFVAGLLLSLDVELHPQSEGTILLFCFGFYIHTPRWRGVYIHTYIVQVYMYLYATTSASIYVYTCT